MKHHTPPEFHEQTVFVELIGAGATGSKILAGLVQLHHAMLELGHPRGLHVRCWDFDMVLFSGIFGFLCNDNKLNLPVVYLGAILIPLTIAVRILHIILLRKNQFYTISTQSITSEGGVLIRFNHTLRRNQIQSVSYTQTLIQQLLGCGNIVVSTSATHRAALILYNVDRVVEIYFAINNNR